jgi:uncharacterized protein (DUF486 family)
MMLDGESVVKWRLDVTPDVLSVRSPQKVLFAMTLAYWLPIVLLIASNVFMTTAWYGHLRFPAAPLVPVIFVSWGIALFEYCLAVPANRIGRQVWSTAELKTMQEVITLVVFAIFSVLVLKEAFTWKHAAGFALIGLGAGVIFYKP